jgi:hypothetical protein
MIFACPNYTAPEPANKKWTQPTPSPFFITENRALTTIFFAT